MKYFLTLTVILLLNACDQNKSYNNDINIKSDLSVTPITDNDNII